MTVRLVSPEVAHAELWLRWRREAATVRHNPVKQSGLEDISARLAACSHDLTDASAAEYRWMVESGGDIVGTVSLSGVNHAMGYGEIGYMLGERWFGRGLGTQCVRLLVEKVFAETSLRRLLAYTAVENVASWKLLEKLGFVREGTLREHYLISGRAVSEHVYGLLRTDSRL